MLISINFVTLNLLIYHVAWKSHTFQVDSRSHVTIISGTAIKKPMTAQQWYKVFISIGHVKQARLSEPDANLAPLVDLEPLAVTPTSLNRTSYVQLH